MKKYFLLFPLKILIFYDNWYILRFVNGDIFKIQNGDVRQNKKGRPQQCFF